MLTQAIENVEKRVSSKMHDTPQNFRVGVKLLFFIKSRYDCLYLSLPHVSSRLALTAAQEVVIKKKFDANESSTF